MKKFLTALLKKFLKALFIILAGIGLLIMGVIMVIEIIVNLNSYHLKTYDGITVGINSHDVFVAVIETNFETTDIVIYDEYEGKQVTSLGGNYESGAPICFQIEVPEYKLYYVENSLESDYIQVGNYRLDNHDRIYFDGVEIDYEEYTYHIKLPKYLNTIYYIYPSNSYALGKVSYTEDKTIAKFYIINYYFEIDSSNEFFYTKDGLLYDKKTNTLVEMN